MEVATTAQAATSSASVRRLPAMRQASAAHRRRSRTYSTHPAPTPRTPAEIRIHRSCMVPAMKAPLPRPRTMMVSGRRQQSDERAAPIHAATPAPMGASLILLSSDVRPSSGRRRAPQRPPAPGTTRGRCGARRLPRSEEHTSELQSRQYLVCRLLLEKKNKGNLTSLEPAFAELVRPAHREIAEADDAVTMPIGMDPDPPEEYGGLTAVPDVRIIDS